MNLSSTTRGSVLTRAAGTIIATLALFLSCIPHAFATHAEGVSVTASDTSGGATNVTYTAQFSIGAGNGATIPDQGDVVVTFPAGYDLSGASIDSFTINGAAGGGTPDILGNQAQFTDIPGVLSDGTAFVVVISGVTNPSVGSAPTWSDATFATPVAGMPFSEELAVNVGATSVIQNFQLQVWGQTVGDFGSMNTSGAGFVALSSGTSMSIAAGALPTGLSITYSTDGAHRIASIGGTPSIPGESYSFTLRAENGVGLVEQTFSGTVTPLSDLALSMTVAQSMFLAAGDVLDISYSVTNGGPVDIAALSVTSPQAGLATCAAAVLLVGETTTCTSAYVVQPSDVAADGVTLTATAIGDTLVRAHASVTVGSMRDLVQSTHEAAVASFIQQRQRLLSSSVYFPGLGQRLRGSAGLSASGNGTTGALSFATSLAQISSGALSATETLAYTPHIEDMPFNLWLGGSGTWHENTEVGSSGTFALASFGGDYLVHEGLLIGAAIHFDWLHDQSTDRKMSGNGYLVGPYISAELIDGVILDAGLFLGRSQNTSDLTIGASNFSGLFETDRILFDAVMRGVWTSGALSILPNAGIHISHEASGAYTVTGPGGALVPVNGVESTFFRASVGTAVEYDIDLGGGLVLTPDGTLTIGVGNGGTAGVVNEVHGELSTGLSLASDRGWTLSGKVETQMDTSGFRAITLGGKFGGSF